MAAFPIVPGGIGRERFATLGNSEDNLTARAGGGQASATALTAQLSRITTVATTGDSVSLPKIVSIGMKSAQLGAVGTMMFVRNDGTSSVQVYGTSPDTINSVATGTGASLAPDTTAIFYAASLNTASNAGNWVVLTGAIARTIPAGLPSLPLVPVSISSTGVVTCNYSSAVDAAIFFRSSIYVAVACTVGTGGVDTIAGNNTFFATMSYACKTWTGGSIVNLVSNITEEPLDFRSTDTSQIGVAKTINGADSLGGLVRIQTSTAHTYVTGQRAVIAAVVGTTEANGNWLITVTDSTHFTIPVAFVNAYVSGGTATNQIPLLKVIKGNGFNVTWRTAALVDPATAAWSPDGVLTNIYSPGPAWLTASATVTRALRTDVLDGQGLPSQFVKFTSKAALAAATTVNGIYYDAGAKEPWLHMAGDANVNTNKAVLRFMFTNTAGSSRTIVNGAALAVDGVLLEGVQWVQIDGNGRPSEIFVNNCPQRWPTAKGWDGTQTGIFCETNTTAYASEQDMRNGFATSANEVGLFQHLNCRYINSADLNVFPLDGTAQGASCHGGVAHVGFNPYIVGSNGPSIGDTCANNKTDVTWIIGGTSGPSLDTSVANITIGSAATNALRTAYFDSHTSVKGGTFDLQFGANAVVNVYNSPTIAAVTGGSVTYYRPETPA